MLKASFKAIFSLILVALTASGCTFPWEKDRTLQDMPLVSYANNNQKNSGPSGDLKKNTDAAFLKDFMFSHSAATSMISAIPGADANQVLAVEGNYIYTLVKNDIFITNSLYAPQAKVVGKISFPSRPLGILVSGQRVAVYGVDTEIKSSPVWNSFKREGDYLFFKIYDVADPTSPKEVRDLSFEGQYAGVKLIGSHAYLMTTANINYLENEPLTPRILEAGQVVSGDCRDANNCLIPEVFYFDYSYNNYYFLSVASISLSDTSKALVVNDYLLDSNQEAYAPTNSLYLTYTNSVSEYDLQNELKRDQVFNRLSAADQQQIKEIEALPENLLSSPEKAVKVAAIVNAYTASLSSSEKDALQAAVDSSLVEKIKANMNEIENTTIYKIIFDAGKIAYQAKGNIFGQIIKGSGLSESDGQVRLVASRNEMWSKLFKDTSKVYNNLYVLDDGLRVLGKLENIATGAKLHEVKFMGNRAYLKTAKVNDALYVADFSDSTKPGILGAVQLPNSSAQIYQADDKGNVLLSFGRNQEVGAESSLVKTGLKLSLFDFSDLQSPKELSGYVIGDANSDSMALNNHQALYNSISANIISVPVSLYDNNRLSFSGALVFSTDGGVLNLKGRVDHSLGGLMSAADSWQGFSYYDNTVRYSTLADTDLLTFSNKFLKINKIASLSEVGSLLLTPGEESYIITTTDIPEIPKIPESAEQLAEPGSDSISTTTEEMPPLSLETSATSTAASTVATSTATTTPNINVPE
ncbi:MAG: beta-propeller domain-containing protein [Candidatus Falkowbacteria bacterium]|nr:MAG: beta-propeller domain-containing protein [Candidatus Falkowbacteria bacterium]